MTARASAKGRTPPFEAYYQALADLQQALIDADPPERLLERVCAIALKSTGFRLAWIGQPDPATQQVKPVVILSGGADGRKLSSIRRLPEPAEPTTRAFTEARHVVVNDRQSRRAGGRSQRPRGTARWRSIGSFPILLAGSPFAILTLCHDVERAFNDDVIEWLDRVVGIASFGLDNLDREAQRRATLDALDTCEERYSTVFDNSPNALALIRLEDGRLIEVNEQWRRLIGKGDVSHDAHVDGENDKPLWLNARQRAAFYKALAREGQVSEREATFVTPHGPVDCLVSGMRLLIHGVTGGLLVVQTKTARRKIDEWLWGQARLDLLTGLTNRSMFYDRLCQELKHDRRDAYTCALLYIDLDGFKQINDALGHREGDRVLSVVADRIARCVRDSDTVARMSGDEFVVLLSELSNTAHVEEKAQSILDALAEPVGCDDGGKPVQISACIGIAMYPVDATDADALLRDADHAMRAAKKVGRNGFRYFTAQMQRHALARLRMIEDLRNAVRENQFELEYQPIVDLSTGRIAEAEALLRWRHPTLGSMRPETFIPLAEEHGLIQELGNWTFMQATDTVRRWAAAYPQWRQMTINVSAVQIQRGYIDLDAWLVQLNRLGLSGQNIIVEITESTLLNPSRSVLDQLRRFKDAEIQVALDDFGTGYSAMSYLKRLPIDYLKIAREFIEDLETDSSSRALAEAIVVMGHKLDMKVIAEGVETPWQREWLSAIGCDYAQGYLFSPPLGAEGFETLLRSDVRQSSQR